MHPDEPVNETPKIPEATVGRIVHYKLSKDNAEEINRRRTTTNSIRDRIAESDWPIGAQAHIGNPVTEGQIVPAMVVAVWGGNTINLQCFLDGCDCYWALSRQPGDLPGQWSWPPRA